MKHSHTPTNTPQNRLHQICHQTPPSDHSHQSTASTPISNPQLARMCHSLTRILCRICQAQIGQPELKTIPCLEMRARPAWGSGISQMEQHRVKRFKKTTEVCEACREAEAEIKAQGETVKVSSHPA